MKKMKLVTILIVAGSLCLLLSAFILNKMKADLLEPDDKEPDDKEPELKETVKPVTDEKQT